MSPGVKIWRCDCVKLRRCEKSLICPSVYHPKHIDFGRGIAYFRLFFYRFADFDAPDLAHMRSTSVARRGRSGQINPGREVEILT